MLSRHLSSNIDDAFAPLADYVRTKGRLVLNTEFGGGSGTDCITDIGQQLAFLNANSDGERKYFLLLR